MTLTCYFNAKICFLLHLTDFVCVAFEHILYVKAKEDALTLSVTEM